MNDSFEKIFKDKNSIMIVLAHPDDMEIVSGGTVARLSDSGKRVRLVVTTNGGKGMQKSGNTEEKFSKIRIKEQMEGAKLLGIDENENYNLNIPDGEFEDNIENIGLIVKHIRDFQPEIVITHNPNIAIVNIESNSGWVNHRDHRKTALATLDAIYPYSRDYGFYPDQIKKGSQPFSVRELLYVDSYNDANTIHFSIDKYLEAKKSSLLKHVVSNIAPHADDYIEENKQGDGYYESFGYMSLY